jgi:xanthine dehydrogenase/oxidase
MSRVRVRVKRLGGAFGGKNYRSLHLAVITALTAQRYQRPVQLGLTRSDDMRSTGHRHAFVAQWRAGATAGGRLRALDAMLYCEAGWSDSESGAVCNRAMWAIDGCYSIGNLRVEGRLVRTNVASGTAFRGFGSPQGAFVVESIMEEVALVVGLSAAEVRRRNMYCEGEATHFGQRLVDWHVPLLWDHLRTEAKYARRRKEADEFNNAHEFRKRGLAMVPTKFGVAFTAKQLNQAGALVQILADGSVLISHGGVEMGQGIHRKLELLAAEALGAALDDIHISETSTATVPNTSPTAGSTGTDLNGGAVLHACQILRERLRAYRERLGPHSEFKAVANAALEDGTNLAATGFYKTPGLSDIWGQGDIFDYFTQGVAIAEVELDVLTGSWTCLRADVKVVRGQSGFSARRRRAHFQLTLCFAPGYRQIHHSER